MKPSRILVAAASVVVAGAWVLTPEPAEANLSVQPIAAAIKREPILVYDVSGSTIAGPIHRKLTVYNDGLATFASFDFFDPDGSAESILVPVSAAEALRVQLILANAHALGDNGQIATDSPISTVTFFAYPGTRSKANTFSWYFPNAGQSVVLGIIQDFIDTHFNAS